MRYTHFYIQGGSNMTGTCAACLHTNQSRSYLNHLVYWQNRICSLIAEIRYEYFDRRTDRQV